MQQKINFFLLQQELTFSYSRSSGPGGQNVNKVNTKVTVKLDVPTSAILTPEQKQTLIQKLSTRLTNEGVIVLSAQDKRSQLQNKEAAIVKLQKLLAKAFEKRKKRKATVPSKAAKLKRLETKKRDSQKKQWREKI
jgi:ribosome-associated protein